MSIFDGIKRVALKLRGAVLGFFDSSSFKDPLLLITGAAIIIGFALRIYQLQSQSLWLDEFYSVEASRASPWAMYQIYSNDIVKFIGSWDVGSPPLYYWILGGFEYFGANDFIMRLPSVIFGALTIPLIYKTGKVIFGRPTGVMAAVLLVFSPFHIWFSQEARAYALFAFLALLMIYFYYKCISADTSGKPLNWAGLIIASILAVYTHYHAFLLIGVLLLHWCIVTSHSKFVKKKIEKRKVAYFVISFAIIFLVVIPSALNFLNGYNQVSGKYNASYFQNFFNFDLFRSDVLGPFTVTYGVSSASFLPIAILGVLLFASAILFFVIGIRRYRSSGLLVILAVVMPFIFIYASVFNSRYLVFIYPFYLILIAKGVQVISEFLRQHLPMTSTGHIEEKQRRPRISGWIAGFVNRKGIVVAIVAIIICTNTFVLNEFYRPGAKLKEDWKSAINYIDVQASPGDVVLTSPKYTEKCIWHYMYRSDVLISSVTDVGEFNNSSFQGHRMWLLYTPYAPPSVRSFIVANSTCRVEYSGGLKVYVMDPYNFNP
ncbi:MAG: glycosyltransferase family 39 protein [Euryarchaeota archaeon]|nr:glycosyltransferase family 39 protein [Euryarchaeota archaeon]